MIVTFQLLEALMFFRKFIFTDSKDSCRKFTVRQQKHYVYGVSRTVNKHKYLDNVCKRQLSVLVESLLFTNRFAGCNR